MQLKMHMVTIEDLVPKGHFLRKLESALDLSFVYEETAKLYSHRYGRPPYDPVVMVKYLLVGYLYGIPSERQIEQRIQTCKNRHSSPICTRFEHHFHALKPHLHRRSFSDTLPENQRHLIALKRHPLWHMQKLCQLSQPAELRSTFFRNRNAVLCQDVLQLSNPLALSLEFFLSCVKVFHRLTLHLVVAGPFQL